MTLGTASTSAKLDAARATVTGQTAGVVPMRRQTIGGQIRAVLRREIIIGQLLPRAMLSEQELSQRFGVSRTPIREALIKLADENLVEIYPQYGSFVAPIKLQDVFDSQFVRESLECAAIERAVERIDATQVKALRAILHRQPCQCVAPGRERQGADGPRPSSLDAHRAQAALGDRRARPHRRSPDPSR